MRTVERLFLTLWVAPYSAIGVVLGMLGLITGGRVQRRRGCIEFHGGAVRTLLAGIPGLNGVLAMTLGHVILGQTGAALDIARDHEHVHVRQFERWGPLMGPAYVGVSVWIWLRGGRAYRDNPFEREAYAQDAMRRKSSGDC